jgi:phenylpyruvate tautomerase
MPYLTVQTNINIDADTAQDFVNKASSTVSEILGKPESYVMVSLQPPAPMSFAGSAAPTAYLELKSIGLPEKTTDKLSSALCALISDDLDIEKGRIYIEFANAERHMWGWNSATF